MTAYRYISADTGLHVRLMKDDSEQNNRVITTELIAAGGTINAECHMFIRREPALKIILSLATSFMKYLGAKLPPRR